MRQQYFTEVQTYRMAAVTKPLTLNRKRQAEPRVEILVKYFDESLGLEENIVEMLNGRIKEIETQARTLIANNSQQFIEQSIKLNKYENLPIDRRFLASMPVEEIF
jgi:hypothetical protein